MVKKIWSDTKLRTKRSTAQKPHVQRRHQHAMPAGLKAKLEQELDAARTGDKASPEFLAKIHHSADYKSLCNVGVNFARLDAACFLALERDNLLSWIRSRKSIQATAAALRRAIPKLEELATIRSALGFKSRPTPVTAIQFNFALLSAQIRASLQPLPQLAANLSVFAAGMKNPNHRPTEVGESFLMLTLAMLASDATGNFQDDACCGLFAVVFRRKEPDSYTRQRRNLFRKIERTTRK